MTPGDEVQITDWFWQRLCGARAVVVEVWHEWVYVANTRGGITPLRATEWAAVEQDGREGQEAA